jgi:hypothetical protein
MMAEKEPGTDSAGLECIADFCRLAVTMPEAATVIALIEHGAEIVVVDPGTAIRDYGDALTATDDYAVWRAGAIYATRKALQTLQAVGWQMIDASIEDQVRFPAPLGDEGRE